MRTQHKGNRRTPCDNGAQTVEREPWLRSQPLSLVLPLTSPVIGCIKPFLSLTFHTSKMKWSSRLFQLGPLSPNKSYGAATSRSRTHLVELGAWNQNPHLFGFSWFFTGAFMEISSTISGPSKHCVKHCSGETLMSILVLAFYSSPKESSACICMLTIWLWNVYSC